MTPETFLARLEGVQRTGEGWKARCPGHDDREPSLSVHVGDDGRLLLNCFAGCTVERILVAMGLGIKDLFNGVAPPGPGGGGDPPLPVDGVTPSRPEHKHQEQQDLDGRDTPAHPPVTGSTPSRPPGITLEQLSEAKKLPVAFLSSLAVRDFTYSGNPAVRIPYLSPGGEIVAARFRLSMDLEPRFVWRKGDKPTLYGLQRLDAIRAMGWAVLVEGESDSWTGWYHGIPVLGIPGKSMWREAWRDHLVGLQIFLWQEPGAEDLSRRVALDLPDLLIIAAPPDLKDLSEAHLKGRPVLELIESLKKAAVPAKDLKEKEEQVRTEDLRLKAARVLEAPDPLILIKEEFRKLGYGGDLRYPVITYLSATSRLLAMRTGSMPVHLLLIGIPSAGKSYTLSLVVRLLPPEAFHTIDAGSPRVLIYDNADLRHRVVIFTEADSIPTDEDNPAASALRNLLQDHRLHYQVTVRDPKTGDFTIRHIERPGPSTLITTAVKRLGAQLDSRLFSLEIPEDQDHIRKALRTQAELELKGCPPPDEALVAFQAYLQTLAPFEVVVPFVERLSEEVGRLNPAPRMLRDFARLLSLVKSVTVLRHAHRRRDPSGRLIAEVEDYRAVYDLVQDMYQGTITGAPQGMREVVKAVSDLKKEGQKPISITLVAKRVGIDRAAVSRRVSAALKHHWLVNNEERKGRPADLDIGEELPENAGLPLPDRLEGCDVVTPLTDGGAPPPPPPHEVPLPPDDQENGPPKGFEVTF